MIKKIILGLCFLAFLTPQTVFADSAPISKKEIKEVEQFFNTYIYSANNYKDDLIDKYTQNAEIERVVIKPDGTKQAVDIPMQRYIKELKLGRKTAKLLGYKNTYINKKYIKTGDNEYKIITTRIPFRDKEGLNAEFDVVKTPDGLKIAKESMETTVQRFLKEAEK